jgi:septal ring-binding cell division protein DamX
MARSTPTQLEMFDAGSAGQQNKGSFFSSRNIGIEKKIIIIISHLIIAIAAFSLGIEKGKNLVAQTANLRVNAFNIKAEPSFVKKNMAKTPLPLDKTQVLNQAAAAKPSVNSVLGSYTIQIASFSKVENAQNEVARFAKKGYKTFTVNKGSYVLLCLGNFSSKEEANNSQELKSVKQIVKDYYIRKL